MVNDWNKPVVTKDGLVPLMSPPNKYWQRTGWINDVGPYVWEHDGTSLEAPKYSLYNKPETIKVWLALRLDLTTGQWYVHEDDTKPIPHTPAVMEIIHGPIEITIPEEK